MKKIILSLAFVGGLLTCSTSLNAFTAVTSGLWSSAATWGGIGPGSTVLNQDIIIPNGITVTLDVDVNYTGTVLNSFTTNGTLSGSMGSELLINSGTFSGGGSIVIHKLAFAGLLTTYNYTGTMTLDVFRVAGPAIALTSQVAIGDSLDLEQGSVVLNSGGNVVMVLNSTVRVNNGTLTAAGGTFTALNPYDVVYVGATKNTGAELNSTYLDNVWVMLTSNTMNLMLSSDVVVNGMMSVTTGNVHLNGSTLRLNSDFDQSAGSSVVTTSVDTLIVDGTGVMATSIHFDTLSSIGMLEIIRDSGTVHLSGGLIITNRVLLSEGILSVDTLSSMTMATGSLFSVDNGSFYTIGEFDGTQTYDVEYIGRNTYTGPELSGSGLMDVRIEQRNNYHMVYLMDDLVVPGNFNLQKGAFNLNGSDLTLNGTFDQEDTTSMWSNPLSTLTMSMSTSVNDTLFSDLPGIVMKNLIIDLPVGSTLTIGRNITVADTLNFMSGKLNVGDATLSLGGSGVILNITGTSYVVTDGIGTLRLFLNAGDSLYTRFPIGTPGAYTPADIQQTVNGDTGYVRARVMEGVYTNGDSGTDVSTTQSVVNKTWVIWADSAVDLDHNISLVWGVPSEVNGFNRTQSYIKHYSNSMWDSYPFSAATPVGTYFRSTRMGVTDPGAYAVVDSASPLAVTEIAIPVYNVYPNPTSDFVNVSITNPASENMQYEVYDAAGRLVSTFANANAQNQIDLSNYERGSYTLRVTNLTTKEVTTRLIIKS